MHEQQEQRGAVTPLHPVLRYPPNQSLKNVSVISIISQTTSRIALSLLSIIPTPFFGEGLGWS